MGKTKGARGFGSLRKLPSGNWQATFTGPDGIRHKSSETFQTERSGEGWLRRQELGISTAAEQQRAWIPPEVSEQTRMLTFSEQAAILIARPLKPKTLTDYWRMFTNHLEPIFGSLPLNAITPSMVSAWYATLCPDNPAMRAHVYSLGHEILQMAVNTELLDRNPFRIKSAMTTKRVVSTELPSELEVAIAIAAMPDRYRIALQLAAGIGLRSGEARALQRGDVDLKKGVLHVRRGVVQAAKRFGGMVVDTPKTRASIRDMALPDWLVRVLQWHLDRFVGPQDDAFLLTAPGSSRPLSQMALWDSWDGARTTAGIPQCRFHNLRRYAATVASIKADATMDEVRRMLGQDDIGVTALYLDEFKGRAEQIAQAIPSLAI